MNREDGLKQAALDYHEFPVPGKLSITPTKQLVNQRDLALAYSPGVAAACKAIVDDPRNALPLHRARQPGRRHHQRHRRARTGQHRPAGRQAGDGRQGGAVQEIRRHRRVRHRDRRRRDPDKLVDIIAVARADLRRHQSRGHQGAGMLHRRAQAARAHENSGFPRRPARHRHHRRGRLAERPAGASASSSPRSSSWSLRARAPRRSPVSS